VPAPARAGGAVEYPPVRAINLENSIPPKIALIDYGFGNIRSVAKALERSGARVEIASEPAAVAQADGVVLPGVGAFADSSETLRKSGLGDAVRDAIAKNRPYLGLCLGLQVLFEEGDEHGIHPGLGVLPGRVERFPDESEKGDRIRIPHIGWNEVRFCGDHPMIERLPASDTFYFVHSYRAVPADAADIAGYTEYGDDFVSAVARDSIFAVQFHPEKSQRSGKRLLDAYCAWVSDSCG
jgi:glutamine amidotransferase